MGNLCEFLKSYFSNHAQHVWLENHFLYFGIIGGIGVITLCIIYIVKLRKDSQRMKKEARKREKSIIKMTSNKKNTTR